MLPDYYNLFQKYNEQLKPLISEIEGRLENFSEPLLKNLAAVFDYMSIAAAEGQDVEKNLKKADSLIDCSLSQSYMYLIYALKCDINKFEREVGRRCLKKLNNGLFVGPYNQLKKELKTLLKEAKKMNDEDALPILKDAYEAATKMEQMVNNELPNVSLVKSESLSFLSNVIRWVISIAISVLAGFVINRLIA